MRRTVVPVILLALCASLRAAEGPRIVGPSTVPVGYALVLTLEGLPKPASFEDFLQRGELLQEWRVYPKPQQPGFGTPRVVVGALSVVLVFDPATSPGRYWVVGHVPAAVGVDCLVEHEIEVTGDKPVPPPPPPPPPPDEVAIMIVRETADSTGAQAILLQKLRPHLSEKKIPLRVLDDDQVDSQGKAPAYLSLVLKAASEANVPLPLLAVCSADFSSVVHVEALPGTFDATVKVIEKWEK